MKSHKCGRGLDHPCDSVPGRRLYPRGENEPSVGSSGISGEMEGVVRRAESQCVAVGGGQSERKGAAMSAR